MMNRVRILMATYLIVSAGYFVVVRPLLAQTQETINERNRSAIETLAQEVDILRKQKLDNRIALLEDAMFEVKYLGRSAAGILLGQLLIGIASSRKTVKGG